MAAVCRTRREVSGSACVRANGRVIAVRSHRDPGEKRVRFLTAVRQQRYPAHMLLRSFGVCGVLVIVGALLGASGCGPVISTYLIVAAQADLDGAQAAEAEKYAVYEY